MEHPRKSPYLKLALLSDFDGAKFIFSGEIAQSNGKFWEIDALVPTSLTARGSRTE